MCNLMKTEHQIRKFINEIPNLVKEMTYEELVTACNEHFPRLPIIVSDFNNQENFFRQQQLPGKNLIYRARKITNQNNTPHEYLSDIDCIPNEKKHLITEFGRVNKPQERMFYGALDYSIACFETLSKGKDFQNIASAMTTVGCWIIDKPFKIAQIPFSKKYINKLEATTGLGNFRISEEGIAKQEQHYRQLLASDLEYDKMQLFADAFANFEIENEHDYYLSNYYKDRVFNKIENFKLDIEFGAIQYPSVPSSFERDNIVLLPEVAENSLTFLNGMQVWVVFDKENMKNLQFLPIEQMVRCDSEGKLNWR